MEKNDINEIDYYDTIKDFVTKFDPNNEVFNLTGDLIYNNALSLVSEYSYIYNNNTSESIDDSVIIEDLTVESIDESTPVVREK